MRQSPDFSRQDIYRHHLLIVGDPSQHPSIIGIIREILRVVKDPIGIRSHLHGGQMTIIRAAETCRDQQQIVGVLLRLCAACLVQGNIDTPHSGIRMAIKRDKVVFPIGC